MKHRAYLAVNSFYDNWELLEYIGILEVGKDVVVLEVKDAETGKVKWKRWIPKRFIKRIEKQNGSWILIIDYEGYCEWYSNLKTVRRIKGGYPFSCYELKLYTEEVKKKRISGKEYGKLEEEEESLEDWWSILETDEYKEMRKKEPKELKELKKLLREFGIEDS